jgi:asparagine synthase (glutamine-hydrolysing)
MCGIAGIINFHNHNLNDVKESLLHRGPDSQNIFIHNNIAFIHTRLAIQDVSYGQQPFHYKNFSIVFNGEIYNHLQLRLEYLKGSVFKTQSDTETLLHLYIKYKNKMFNMLDGMFAFAVLDKNQNKIILARDRAGKKPLYIYKNFSSVLFASELNSINTTVKDLTINEDAISSYLRTGFFYKKYTPYKEIEEVEAGCIYTIDIDSLKLTKERFFNFKEYYLKQSDQPLHASIKEVECILDKSVKDRLFSSDIEVGAFLSGGIDSGLIVAMASKYQKNLKTFTVKFDGAYDESSLARLVSKKYDTKHHEIEIKFDVKKDIEKILLNYGEPFMDSSAVPSYYVSQEAKKHVSVILNGDGADELFGGYRRYVPAANHLLTLASYFSSLLKVMPVPHNKKTFYNYFYRLLEISNKSGLDYYLSSTSDVFEGVYEFNDNHILRQIDQFLLSNSELSDLSRMLLHDSEILLFSDLLPKIDIATMNHSLEGRSPFLSKYMLEFVPTLPDNQKVKGGTTKVILRELAKKYLPSEIINQPKRGFEIPLKKWVDIDLKENIYDRLLLNSYSSSFVDQDFIRKLLDKKVSVSDEKRAKMIWSMYCLEVWKDAQ